MYIIHTLYNTTYFGTENSKMSPQSNGSSTVLPLLTTSSGVFALHLSETRNEEAMSIGSEEAKRQTQSGK